MTIIASYRVQPVCCFVGREKQRNLLRLVVAECGAGFIWAVCALLAESMVRVPVVVILDPRSQGNAFRV
ncbi:hypothetical protein [Zhongshania aquimaris]|uniref:Uncharacterized protein n=1 Tax=Zhongshania aquimaris TaxID=2857107 RepID=A0ABS6VVF5_9GAMM|nr:hypothetical protein [Zhongshania aquimaris]MBW2941984.1 hypothetical protein [Zhongshania aquimaris]